MRSRQAVLLALSLGFLVLSPSGAVERPILPPSPGRVIDGATDASPPLTRPDFPAGAPGYSRYVHELRDGVIHTTLVEGPLGPQQRLPWSYQRLRELSRSGADPPEELGMSREELTKLVEQLDTVRQATDVYHDVDVAVADGYRRVADEVPNMGAHYVRDALGTGQLDLERPEMLMYSQTEDGTLELVGTAFLLDRGIVGDGHPDGFAGPLDNWHVHYDVCTAPPVSSEPVFPRPRLNRPLLMCSCYSDGRIVEPSSTKERCADMGGRFMDSYGWMIHAWVWTENPLGVFHMFNPNVPPLSSSIAAEQASDWNDGRSFSDEAQPAPHRDHPIASFELGDIEVKVGTGVRWTNVDPVPHTVTSGAGGLRDGHFDSGVLGTGAAFTEYFDALGQYLVFCQIHPQMAGRVTVVP